MITRYLEHFTQEEVDKASGETLIKDLPYGGNRPYVIGTLLRDPETGEHILWRKGGTQAHRLCIEHAPHEFVEWTIATENMTSATIVLQQLTRSYPFAKVKRIGMIPLNAAAGTVPSTYYDSAYCLSRSSVGSLQNTSFPYFMMAPEQCELKLTQEMPLSKPTYCEIDALSYAPFFTDKVYFSNLHIGYSARGVLFYCVYELHDGLFHYPFSDLKHDGQYVYRFHSMFRIPLTNGYLRQICINGFDAVNDENHNLHARLYKRWLSSNGLWGVSGIWSQDHSSDNQHFFYNVNPGNYSVYYGEFLTLEFESNFNYAHRSAEAWFHFTSNAFHS